MMATVSTIGTLARGNLAGGILFGNDLEELVDTAAVPEEPVRSHA